MKSHPEYRLHQGTLKGAVVYSFEDERPARGLMGELDWRLNGHFSRWAREQRITGKLGESIYLPLKWNEKTFHFLVIGAGQVKSDGRRPPLTKSLKELAKKKWAELELGQVNQFLFEEWE